VPVIRADSPHFISFALILAECDAGHPAKVGKGEPSNRVRWFRDWVAVGMMSRRQYQCSRSLQAENAGL